MKKRIYCAFSLAINTCMKLYEITSPIKMYIARVKLKNGATVTATECTESLYFATQIFKHKFGDNKQMKKVIDGVRGETSLIEVA